MHITNTFIITVSSPGHCWSRPWLFEMLVLGPATGITITGEQGAGLVRNACFLAPFLTYCISSCIFNGICKRFMHPEGQACSCRVGVANSDAFQGQASTQNERSWPDGREKWKEHPRGVQREGPYASDSANPHCSTSQVSKTNPNGFMCQMLILKR